MFTFIGVVLIILAIYQWSIRNTNKKADTYNNNPANKGKTRSKKMPTILPTKPLITFSIAVAIILLNGLFFWNNAGTITAIQYPWGGDKMVATQGVKVKGWGRVIPLSYEISIKDLIIRGEEELPESHDGIYNRKAKKWEFSDAIKADIAVAIVIEIVTEDEEKFLAMADRNRSEGKLISGRVLPNIDAALKNTCKLMDAQDYISGAASEFDRYFRDQLQNGMYLVEEYYETEATPEIIGDTLTVRTVGSSTQRASKQKKFRIKEDSQGNKLRDNSSNSLSQYGIKFIQAQVTSIDWETSFDERLDLQKDEVAKTQLEKQVAERQYYTAKKEIAAGEAAKAKERAALEKQQIKLTIAAETEAKVAEQNLIAEKKKYEVAKFEALSKKVAADAQYYENQKLVSAGLTPQERVKAEIEMNKDKWDNISKITLPSTFYNGAGGKGGSASMLESVLSAKLLDTKVK